MAVLSRFKPLDTAYCNWLSSRSDPKRIFLTDLENPTNFNYVPFQLPKKVTCFFREDSNFSDTLTKSNPCRWQFQWDLIERSNCRAAIEVYLKFFMYRRSRAKFSPSSLSRVGRDPSLRRQFLQSRVNDRLHSKGANNTATFREFTNWIHHSIYEWVPTPLFIFYLFSIFCL